MKQKKKKLKNYPNCEVTLITFYGNPEKSFLKISFRMEFVKFLDKFMWQIRGVGKSKRHFMAS